VVLEGVRLGTHASANKIIESQKLTPTIERKAA
jgi:hypothetical protein